MVWEYCRGRMFLRGLQINNPFKNKKLSSMVEDSFAIGIS